MHGTWECPRSDFAPIQHRESERPRVKRKRKILGKGEPAHRRIIRKSEVVRRTGYSAVQIWRFERDGLFPKRVLLADEPDLGPAENLIQMAARRGADPGRSDRAGAEGGQGSRARSRADQRRNPPVLGGM